MATQRLTVATIAGRSAVALTARFGRWRSAPDPAAVDRLCEAIRRHALSLPVVYFAEWVDRWLAGDQIPGPGAVEGRRFQAACLSPAQAREHADRCGGQYAEQGWLAVRLREAAAGWGGVAEPYAVVVIREAVGASPTDDEVRAAAESVPGWLSPPDQDAEPPAPHGPGAKAGPAAERVRSAEGPMTPDAFRAMVEANAVWFAGARPEPAAVLDAAERALGVGLPRSLRWLLGSRGYSAACGIDSLDEAVAATPR